MILRLDEQSYAQQVSLSKKKTPRHISDGSNAHGAIRQLRWTEFLKDFLKEMEGSRFGLVLGLF